MHYSAAGLLWAIILILVGCVLRMSFIAVWARLVLLLFIFLMIQVGPLPLFKFVLLQEVTTLLFLVARFFSLHVFIAAVLLFKMALPPFHIWFSSLLFKIRWPPIALFLSLFKVLPFLLLFEVGVSQGPLVVLILLRGAFLFLCDNVVKLIFFSSASSAFWILLLGRASYYKAITLLVLYVAFMVYFFFLSEGEEYRKALFIVLMGFPPLLFFLVKYFIGLLVLNKGLVLALILAWLINFKVYMGAVVHLKYTSLGGGKYLLLILLPSLLLLL